MSFIADKQTLEDLNLLGRYKSHSISRLFDQTITNGGRQLLEQLFREPLTDAGLINERVRIFRYFGTKNLQLPFTNGEFSVMENYLRSSNGNFIETGWNITLKKLRSKLTASEEYSQVEAGCRQTIHLLQQFRKLIEGLEHEKNSPVAGELESIQQLFLHKNLQWLDEVKPGSAISLKQLISYDHCLRGKLQKEMKALVQLIFRFDVNIAVSGVATSKGFCYPRALPAGKQVMHITGLVHPLLARPVSNAAEFSSDNNVLFLTGANMAGKSTYMKSFGIAVYLAHMGFPVPAENMEFSVKDGIFSSINVPDDLEHGYSHFYAEVLRVKTVAQAVDSGKNLVVIFDELFKGTNVKDAYEATLSITEALSRHRNCFFIISTHIIEVGHALQTRSANIRFLFMPTVMNGNIPAYTYRLKEGITADRQGMMIIENEKILDLIRQG
ncbi:MAG: MutS-related protein [Pseudobacter sp.]|uniref:MutS-related protein n=1 Tax=Pseudobacter sp. TaxID=2045420 RepID=UPI003F812AE3